MKKALAQQNEAATAGERGGSVREPLQARGRARIETVLDAAAVLIVEKGLTGVTMHGVARRAHTPIGSMYHFFPDRESLLNALWDRHIAAIDEIDAELGGHDMNYWRGITSEEVIDRFMTPFITYMEQHADCLILMSIMPHDDEHKNKRKAGTLRKVLDVRMPGVKASERALYVDMLHALASGALAVKLRPAMGDVQLASRYLREVRRALAAYLATVEAAIGGAS